MGQFQFQAELTKKMTDEVYPKFLNIFEKGLESNGGQYLVGSSVRYVEDICFFEVNTKYISSSELKTSEFSRVRSTSENYYVFNSRDEIYLVFTEKKQIFFLFYPMHRHFPMH